MNASTRWLAGIAVVVAAVVIVGAVAAASGGRTQSFADGTPERAVQQYLEAVAKRDSAAAMSMLSSDLARRCNDFSRDPISNQFREGVRATLEETTTRDGTARVQVRIIESYGSAPFSSGESSHSAIFELRQESGEWRFTETPWPLYCPPVATAPAIPR